MQQHEFNQISPHIFWLSPAQETDRPILGAISGKHSTLIVDAGNSPAHARHFLEKLSRVATAPPKYLALTHWHWDHVFGSATIDLPTFGHIETKRIVTEMAKLDWSDAALDRRVEQGAEIAFCRDMIKAELPDRRNLAIKPPNMAFTGQVEIDLGETRCQIVHVGGDHSPDSTVVYVPDDKIMFLGDCLSPDLYHGERHYTSRKIFQLLDQLSRYDVKFYLEAHNPDPLTRAEMMELAALFKTIGRLVEQIGPMRAEVLLALERAVDTPLNQDHREMVDQFLVGLAKSQPAHTKQD